RAGRRAPRPALPAGGESGPPPLHPAACVGPAGARPWSAPHRRHRHTPRRGDGERGTSHGRDPRSSAPARPGCEWPGRVRGAAARARATAHAHGALAQRRPAGHGRRAARRCDLPRPSRRLWPRPQRSAVCGRGHGPRADRVSHGRSHRCAGPRSQGAEPRGRGRSEAEGPRVAARRRRAQTGADSMSPVSGPTLYRLPVARGNRAAGIFCGAVGAVAGIVLVSIWVTTQLTAYRLHFHPALGSPLLTIESPYRELLGPAAVLTAALGISGLMTPAWWSTALMLFV